MITRTVNRVMARRMLPQVAAVFFLLLAIAPEAKWRLRDPGASAAGSADLQTLFELGLYAGIGLWAAWHLIRGWSSERYRLQTIGPAGLVLVIAALLLVTTGVLAVSSRSLTRSVQYIVMATTALLIWWEARGDVVFFESFWRIVRRGFVLFALFATFITAIVPAFDGSLDDRGINRYGWMEIHPITTAGMLGIAMLAILGAYLGLPDRVLNSKWIRVGTFASAGIFFILLILTNSRGAIVATLAAMVMMMVTTPRRRLRRFALLVLVAVIGLSVAYFLSEAGSSQLEAFVNRGQTTEQVLSLSQRTTLFDIGMDYFAQKPIFGHGYMIPGTLLRTHFEWAGHAHNVALEIMMSTGLVGLATFLTLVLVIIRGMYLGLKTSTGRFTGLPAEGAALITMILVQGVISDGFAGPVGWEVGILMLTVIIADMGRQWRMHPTMIESTEETALATAETAGWFKPAPLGRRSLGVWSRQPSRESAEPVAVDINTASVEELTALPGVGRRIAGRIVAYREGHGDFVSVDQLIEVRGIGRIVLSRLRAHARVAPPVGASELRLRRW